MYVMSRKSQAIWSHCIEKDADFQGVRYSITLRTVGKQYHRSTIILGDSNTKYLKFGKGNGTFGYNMPGERVYAPVIEQIKPQDCIGYNNIVLHCGINDNKNNGTNISQCADGLIKKIESIRSLCPRSIITVNPVLPSKSNILNTRSKHFNKLIFDYIDARRDYQLHYLNFNVFVDERSKLLKDDLGRFKNQYDQIHLGSLGVRLLVKLIKERVCGNKVDGRPYAGVSSINSGRVNGRRSMNMMSTTTTSSGTLLAPSQQSQT